MRQTQVSTKEAPAAIGPYSQGISTENLVFCSGQVGLDPETGQFVSDDIQGQTEQALLNIKGVLEAAGSDLEHVVKTTVFLTDMDTFQAMNQVYASFFPGVPPARSTIAVKDLPLGALVEIEAIAIKP